jgi:hypothetical protein
MAILRREKQTFLERYLDPAGRLGEVLFGLVMVLTVTLTAGLTVAGGPAGVRQLLLSALGCNVAWGIIDGIMYVMNCVTERAERARLICSLRAAPDSDAALAIVREEVEPALESLAAPADREALSRAIVKHVGATGAPPRPRVTAEDFYGAIGCFWLVFMSCLPAVAPFLLLREPVRALRVSNALLIGMLFVVGQKWAQYARTNRLITGLTMVAIGLALVGVAVALGG